MIDKDLPASGVNIAVDPKASVQDFVEELVRRMPAGKGVQIEFQIPVIEDGRRTMLCFEVLRRSVQ